MKEKVYFVSGLHCPSCEILIEKRLLRKKIVQSVEVSQRDNTVVIGHVGTAPSVAELNKMFRKDGYTFSESGGSRGKSAVSSNKRTVVINAESFKRGLSVVLIVLFVVYGIWFLNQLGVTSLVTVSSSSSLPMFFIFGLLAGISSCAALVGGLVLSMSKQWSDLYGEEGSRALVPHVSFNIGRLASYGALGILLGSIGNFFRVSPALFAIITIGVGLLMLILGLQMLGVKAVSGFSITTPKFLTRYAADERNFAGRYMPFLLGVSTVFLPCGFTITTQGLALTSGSGLQGGLIMLAFALGTLPMLVFVGVTSTKLLRKPHMSGTFLRIAGLLVIIFGLYTVNSQLNVLGAASLDDVPTSAAGHDEDLAAIENGKQVIRMKAGSSAYMPNEFTVRAGVPVLWEIENVGVSGCTNAVISRGLFEGEIKIDDDIVYKEFTPEKPGVYKFSCWMGMVTGTITVIDENAGPGKVQAAGDVIPAQEDGGAGCGCGGGCGGECGNPECPYAK